MQLEPLYLQGRTFKSWCGDTRADDKGRKAGEGTLAAGSCPDLRQSQVDFSWGAKAKKEDFIYLPKCCVLGAT